MGTGKSHIIASYIENVRLKNKQEAILILGQHLNDDKSFKLQIKEVLEIGEDFERFIELLNAKGKEKNIFIPLFIDAINESLYNSRWSNELNGLINIIKKYKYVKLIITLRSDYIHKCLPERMESDECINMVTHLGFLEEKNVYASISKIFQYYGVPIPLFPMINDEYTNPLFIVSLCKWIKNYNMDILIQDYTSFKIIFEKYISMINKRMAKKFNYADDNYLLYDIINKIVEYMVESQKMYITQKDFCNVVRELLQDYGIAPIKFIDALRSEGLIFRSVYSKDEIIYFSYEQYFSILKSNLLIEKIKNNNVINKEKLKNILIEISDIDILKNIFITIGNEYGIEIYDLLNFNEIVDNDFNIINAYASSLLWRKKNNFNISNFEKFIDILKYKYDWVVLNYRSLFYYCSSIEESPFNIYYFNDKLRKMNLVEKDFKFTIELNINISMRMVLYCLNANMDGLRKENRIMLAIALGWILATPNRNLRDNATKALVNLLTNNIETMMQLIDNFKNVDDLYILERIYASCYGAILRSNNNENLEDLLNLVYKNIFNKSEVLPNIIIRYYAKNLILYGQKNGCDIKFDLSKIYAPYNSKWYEEMPTNDEIKKYIIDYNRIEDNIYLDAQNMIIRSMLTEDAEDLGMYGDFGRYEFGFYLSEFNRNFKSEQILSNIAIKRVFDFGYDVLKFGKYDLEQRKKEEYSRYGHEYERIGKKYQWLAMYEVLAKLQDNYQCLENLDKSFEKEEVGVSYYDRDGIVTNFSNAKYKGRIYKECEVGLLNIDVTNLINIPKINLNNIRVDLSDDWLKEDMPDIRSIIEIEDCISLSTTKILEKKSLELCESKTLLEDSKNDSKVKIIYQAYIYENEISLESLEKDNMYLGIPKENDLLLLEYSWKFETKENYNENYYITNYYYNNNFEYDMTENRNFIICQPSKYLTELLRLNQKKDGYWYDNNKNIVCFDNVLKSGENNFLIKKDILIDVLQKNNLNIIWIGYIEKKSNGKIRNYRFRIDRKIDGTYELTKKWAEQEWKY